MKKVYSFFMVTAIAMTANSQIALLENFSSYTSGNLGTQGLWVQSGSGTDVQISTTSQLTYSGYTSGTEYAHVSAVNGTDPHKGFSSNITTSSDVSTYMSFVVRVGSATKTNANPDYSIDLYNTGSTERPLRFYIGEDQSNSARIQFGISTGNSGNSVAWTTSTTFTYNTTYLIVIRYDIFSAAGNNDDAYLWVNPDLSTEPTTASAAASLQNAPEVSFGSLLNALEISQSSNSKSPAADYDAFRIAYGASSAAAWTNLSPQGAPLPVQLTSFNASQDGTTTKLVWNTAEESGITSYVVEKSTDGRTFTAIGSVTAAHQKTYSFTDAQPASDYTYYRLRIVEMDGSYKLSYIVSLKSKLSLNITLSPNPVRNVLMIQHPKVATDGHIQIVSADGRLIKDLRLPANAVISNVDMSGFASGLYHVVFKSGADVFSKTVIKQ